jgi:4-amino-4-deoxy-L-arabinose transferase-like glycosyltransferase
VTRARLQETAKRLEWPLLVFLLALLPRLAWLGARPFWLDEVFTFQRVSLKPAALVMDSFQNHHMPSFFLMLRPFAGFGHPEFWLRLPSAVFGAIAVMLVFLIARQIAGRLAACLAALIMGLSPTALAFSQEARSYTMVMTLILVALYGLARLAQDLPAASRPLRAPDARTGWVCFILGTTAALDVLADGLPWLITANVIAIVLTVMGTGRGGFMRNMLKADLIILALAAPLYLLLEIYQAKAFVQTLAWIPPLDATRLWYSVGSVYLMHLADSVTFHVIDRPGAILVWVIDVALAVAIISAVMRLRRRPAMLVVLGISVLFLPLLLIIISLWQPILLPRYILWSAAPFAVLAGIGTATMMEGLSRRTQVLATVAIAALLVANMLPYYNAETKPRWDIAAQMLAQDVQPGDVVYLHDFYAGKLLEVYLPVDKQGLVLNDNDADLNRAAQALSQGKRVWAVYGLAGQGSGKTEDQDYHDNQKLLGTPTIVQQAGNRIVIALYVPTNLASR